MDIRCPSCSKLFRVADEKIAGKGIRFKCSKCAEVITITKDDFETDLLAREAEPKAPAAAQASAPKAQPAPKPTPQPAPEPVAREYKAQEYQPQQAGTDEDNPSESQQIPQAALSDFDFSEPHAAAASAAHPAEGFGGDFSFDAASQEEAVPEMSLSPEAAAEAEAALDFPVDLIAEPKRKPAFGDSSPSTPSERASEEQELDLGTTLAIPKGTAAESESAATAQESVLDVAQALPKGPVITPELLAQMKRTTPVRPAAQTKRTMSADGDIDLGAALRIPQTSAAADEPEEGTAAVKTFSAAQETAQPSGTVGQHEIHPFASGTMTGAVAGLGCAVPLIALMVAGFGVLAQLMPFSAGISLFDLAALLGSGIIGMSIMIGVMISLVQARAGKKLFFLVNILIGTVFGAAFGVGESAMLSLVTGIGLNVQIIMLNAVMAGVASFVLSILVVIARRLTVNEKDETFSADLSGAQKAGVALALGIVLFAVYQNGSYTASMEQAAKDVRQQPSAAVKPLTITAAGLQIANAHGYIDPATGDLIVSGAVLNTTDKPRSGWYLVIEVRDAKEAVLATAKMVNGFQLYSKAELDVLSKRGAKIEDIQKTISALGEGTIPAKGRVTFEVRVLNPPAGSARFLPTLQSLDLATLVNTMQAGQGRQ
jgi:predicted Zn finger-like uncharacterized protein